MATNKITKLDASTFDQFLRQRDPFANASQYVFDLRGVSFIGPAGLVYLTAACHHASMSGRTAVLMIDDENVRTYLTRTSFFAAIASVTMIEPPLEHTRTRFYEGRRGQNPLLIEVTKIASGIALPALLDQVVDVLRERLRYKNHDAYDVATAVSEIAQNTFDHNRDTYGFLAMQVYKGKAPFLEIAVADYGCGLAATLARNPKNPPVASDVDAIKLATQLGISEHDDPTRGTGLYHLLEITYKHRGSVQIRSGSGTARFRMDQRRGWYLPVPPMAGVQVAVSLPSKAT